MVTDGEKSFQVCPFLFASFMHDDHVDGYGIAYMIQKDAVCFNVAARVGVGAEKMAEALVWAGAQCRGIYEAEAALSGTSIKAKL